MTVKVFPAEFWTGLDCPVLARVLDPDTGEYPATPPTATSVVVIGQTSGETHSGPAAVTWHNPPRGTPSLPDTRWDNRTYEENRAGFNMEAVVPADAFPRRDFYRVEFQVTFASGKKGPVVLEGPAISRTAQS